MRIDPAPLGRRLAFAACVWLGTAAAVASADTIDVTIDFASVLKLDQPAQTVIIGNPGIADATAGNDKTLILTGKTAGTTNLIVIGKDGDQILNTTVRVSSDVQQLTTIFYGPNRQTFSCAPVCEQVIAVGDEKNTFDDASAQIQTRESLSK
jgi:Flp pilus assembly secretin CpaC